MREVYFASIHNAWTPEQFAKSELPLDDADVEIRVFDEDDDLISDNYFICVNGREIYDIYFWYHQEANHIEIDDLEDYVLWAIESAGMSFCEDLLSNH